MREIGLQLVDRAGRGLQGLRNGVIRAQFPEHPPEALGADAILEKVHGHGGMEIGEIDIAAAKKRLRFHEGWRLAVQDLLAALEIHSHAPSGLRLAFLVHAHPFAEPARDAMARAGQG